MALLNTCVNADGKKEKLTAIGTTFIEPPNDYWETLKQLFEPTFVDILRKQSELRQLQIEPGYLSMPSERAADLLDRLASDGWFKKIQRAYCRNCNEEVTDSKYQDGVCIHCGEAFVDHGELRFEELYVRDLKPLRSVRWVIVLHGMNTRGAWQEAFSWRIGTTWGRSIPVAIFKYGFVVTGVVLAWRRTQIREALRRNLVEFRDGAFAHKIDGKPDVIAHSFGTWLIGHLLEEECKKEEEHRFKVGRLILTGCVLRPDFDWQKLIDAGVVEEVLNHYGSNDIVVPLAHYTISDSGPSGRRGFDGNVALNVCAKGFKHSDFFSSEPINETIDDKMANDISTLADFAYWRVWHPFLTLPAAEIQHALTTTPSTSRWKPFPLLLRGALFPFISLPLVVVLIMLAVMACGKLLLPVISYIVLLALVSASALLLFVIACLVVHYFRRRCA